MTSYFSLAFIGVFLPAVVLLYSVVRQHVRWVVLLVGSYIFFWSLSGKLIVFLLLATFVTYCCGLILNAQLEWRDAQLAALRSGAADGSLDKPTIRAIARHRMRATLVLGAFFLFGCLVVLKYLGFFGAVGVSLLELLGISVTFAVPSIGIPIGISFYTLMAVSYLADVYRETIKADRHLGRVALYLAFFPHIMEGPFCRYRQTAFALTAGESLRAANIFSGAVLILWGLCKKIVVADRLNIFVKEVFTSYGSYDGGIIALAAVLYTLQLYCDFSGTMDVAMGVSRIFNVNLPENFRQPFFSRTASEFWQRWHITLGAWFKDYVYYPVSLSKPCKRLTTQARKRFGSRYGPLLASSVALFCVWIGNGLWHGAGSQYLFFGLYYFVIIMAGGLIEPVCQSVATKLEFDRDALPYRAFRIARTLVIVFIGELFFRADSLAAGIAMFSQILTGFSFEAFSSGSFLSIGLDAYDYALVGVFVAILFVVGLARERAWNAPASLFRQSLAFRYATLICLFMVLVIFGAYGSGYTPVDPMYAQF